MTTERNAQGVDGLAEVMGLLGRATPRKWQVLGSLIAADDGVIVRQAAAYDAAPNDLAAIAAAVNYLRSHGEAIRELVEAAHRVLDYGLDTDTAMTGGEWTSAMDSRSNLRAALAKFPEPRP